MTRADRRDFFLFLLFLTGAVLLFFWPMVFQGKGFYYGDYRLQFYPWAKVLSEHIKHFSLPLWVSDIGCGFPLLAEGQSAALYPLNWILFFFLPFPFSYHLSFIVLFFIAGISTYFFTRSVGHSLPGASLTALVYLFGSAYAGLAYGVMSLRVMAWLPLGLFFVERLCRFGEGRDAVFLAAAWAMAFLGGYPQFACYSILLGVFYFGLRVWFVPNQVKTKAVLWVLSAGLLAAGLSACQLLPTAELVGLSSRAGASLEFALQKSFNPLNLATLLWPGTEKFFGFGFFIGVLPLCLAIVGLFLARKNRTALIFSLLGFFFIFLSLGSFNPLVVKFLQWTHLYFFRVPSKFLFFAAFCLAVLAGMGLDFLLEDPKAKGLFLKIVRGTFFAAIGLYGAAFLAARFLKPMILGWGEGYVRRMVVGKAGHTGSLESYLDRLNGLYQAVLERTSLTDVHFVGWLIFWGIFFFILFWKRERFFEKRKLVFFIMSLTITELFFFSFFSTGFRGNQRPAPSVKPDDEIEFLLSRGGVFRTYAMITDPIEGAPHWLPNSNMLFGIDSIGLYTPLATQDYRDFLKELGAVDNASGVLPASRTAVLKNLNLLSLMNVRFILTRENFDGVPDLTLSFVSANGDRIYENRHFLPRAFLTDCSFSLEKNEARVLFSENLYVPNQALEWEQQTPRRLRFKVNTPKTAFLFLSETFYPGWEAKIDGKPAVIIKTNEVFKGLDIPSGKHEVEFVYNPSSFKRGCVVSAGSLLICAVLLIGSAVRRKSR